VKGDGFLLDLYFEKKHLPSGIGKLAEKFEKKETEYRTYFFFFVFRVRMWLFFSSFYFNSYECSGHIFELLILACG